MAAELKNDPWYFLLELILTQSLTGAIAALVAVGASMFGLRIQQKLAINDRKIERREALEEKLADQKYLFSERCLSEILHAILDVRKMDGAILSLDLMSLSYQGVKDFLKKDIFNLRPEELEILSVEARHFLGVEVGEFISDVSNFRAVSRQKIINVLMKVPERGPQEHTVSIRSRLNRSLAELSENLVEKSVDYQNNAERILAKFLRI